jgi:twinkle protein
MYYAELQQLNIDTRGQFSGLIKTICPQCASSRKKQGDPSLSVNIDTGLYKCHHCGWKGSVAGKTYTVPEPRKEDPDGKISNYFEARRISADTMRHFRVTQGRELMPQDGQYHRVICFNYYQDGFLVNIKFKTSDKKFKMVSGARKIPYNLNAIKESDVVIICEGEEETMVWHEAGFPFAVSCPNGASDKTNNLEWLDATYNYFENKKIVLATDNDAPGKKLREDLSRRFDIDNIYVIDFIDGCKDANDVLLAYDKETLQDLFNNAKPLPVKEIAEVGDFLETIESYHKEGYPKGDTIGLSETDKLLSWSRGELVTLTAVPGAGKSTWVDYVYLRLALTGGWKFAIFSPENEPSLKIMRLVEQFMGHPISEMGKEQLEFAINFVKQHFYFFNIQEMENFKIGHILDLTKMMVKRYGIDCLCLDPFNYLELEGTKDTQHENIGELLRSLKKFAVRNNINVTLIAHPRKMEKNNGEYKVPTLYDIAQSSHFFNATDVGMALHRKFNAEPGEAPIQLYVQKMKYHFRGTLGSVEYYFDKETGRYSENGSYDNLTDVLFKQGLLL